MNRRARAEAELDLAWRWCFATWGAWIALGLVGGALWRPLIALGFVCLAIGIVQMMRHGWRSQRIAKGRE